MGSAADSVRENGTGSLRREPFPWLAVAWFAILLFVCYAPVIQRLVNQWTTDDDMGHGALVPIVAAYIAWQRRDKLLAEPASPSWWGLALVIYGAVQLYIATLGAELFLARTAIVVSLVGMILFLGGLRHLRILAFPLFLLCFMIPIPAIIYNQITFPLQLLASEVAESSLSFLGVPVLREGNVLETPTQRLNVVEACSGIRSLLSLSFIALVYAYFFDKRIWMRALLLIATVPIAIAANAGRVTITALAGEYKPELAEGLPHLASGWVVFMLALAILVAFHQLASLVARIFHAR